MSILQGHVDPTLIPLPLSPVSKPRLQSRRPGQRADSGKPPGEGSDAPLVADLGPTPQRSISGRVISLQPGSKPRRVSAAMQYALLPTPPATSPTQSTRNVSASDADLSPTGTAIEYGSEDDEEDRIPLLELDRSTKSSRAPSGWVSQVVSFDEEEEEEGSDEDQDENQEAWIDYVREQLSALFPDVYRPELVSPARASHAPEPISNDPPAGVHSALMGGPRIVSDASTSDLSAVSTQSSDMPMTPLYGDGAHELMVASASGAADTVTRRVLGNVVNVRDEIQAMREEMQRLRGVVGELSEGLRAPGAAIYDPATPRRTDLEIPEEQDLPNTAAEASDVPQGLLENAQLCAAIIRQLHANMSGSNTDIAVFEPANLQHLLQSLQSDTTSMNA